MLTALSPSKGMVEGRSVECGVNDSGGLFRPR